MDRLNDPSQIDPAGFVDPTDHRAVLELFDAICDRTTEVLAGNDEWGLSGVRDGQYRIDLDIDAVCLDMLRVAGLAVLSEESGVTDARGVSEHVVVVDPLDGSTNAALGLPWCATALCLVSNGVPAVAAVRNLRTGAHYAAIVDEGATLNGSPIEVDSVSDLDAAVVAINARPPERFRPAQYRTMGATALDIASVAGPGGFDGSIDFDDDRIGVWDYLASVMILREAGGVAADALGRELVVLDHSARRRPVTATTQALLDQLLKHVGKIDDSSGA